jgi:predicted RNase H-like nuclease (RuvC/YqgF family)
MSWNNQYGSNHNAGTGVYDIVNPLVDALSIGISEGFRRLNARYEAQHSAESIYANCWNELVRLENKKNEIIAYTNQMRQINDADRYRARKQSQEADSKIWQLEHELRMAAQKIQELERKLAK